MVLNFDPREDPPMSDTPKTVDDTVTFAFDLNTIVGYEPDHTADGEYAGTVPVTLADRVAEIIASRLVSQAGREWHPRVSVKADEVADRLVEQKFRDVLEREFVPTDQYGQSKGEPTTIGEVIGKRADAWLREKRSGNNYDRSSKTNLQHLIDEAVGRTFKAELQKSVKAAQDAAVAEVSRQAADVFAEIIRRAAGK
jgi:hypothetical protein